MNGKMKIKTYMNWIIKFIEKRFKGKLAKIFEHFYFINAADQKLQFK